MNQSQPFGRRNLPPATPGSRWGKLTVEAVAPPPAWVFGAAARRKTWVLVACECGTRKAILSETLKDGRVKSCGCTLRENRKEFVRKHTAALRGSTHGKNLPISGLPTEGEPIG
jgi:hypothetical protein